MTRRRSRPDTQSVGAAGPARPARQVRYTVIGDQLCAVRGTEHELVLGLAPQIDRLLYPASAIAADPGLLDPGRQWHDPSSTRPSHVRLRYLHPATGEQQHLTLTYRQAVSGSWLSLPPFVTLTYDSSRLRRVWEAIRLTSPEPQVSALYDSTGWHELPEHGWGWIHARGAITATGHTPAFVHLTGPLAWFDLPDPLTDPSRLREQFQTHSMGLLDRLPERVGAVLLGHIFRAALGPTPVSPLLVGPPGTYKTSLAGLAMHHYGERWDRLGRAAMWLNQDPGTPAAMRWLTHHAKDAVLFCDGAHASAPSQRSLALLIDQVHQNSGGPASPSSSRGSALLTSEVEPRADSTRDKLIRVPLATGDVHRDDVRALEAPDSRAGRALVMSSFLMWLAADLPRQREVRLGEHAVVYLQRHPEQAHGQADGAYGQLWAGWALLTDFLLDAGALTSAERQPLLHRVDQALQAARLADRPNW